MFYMPQQAGTYKVDAAAKTLNFINPTVVIKSYNMNITTVENYEIFQNELMWVICIWQDAASCFSSYLSIRKNTVVFQAWKFERWPCRFGIELCRQLRRQDDYQHCVQWSRITLVWIWSIRKCCFRSYTVHKSRRNCLFCCRYCVKWIIFKINCHKDLADGKLVVVCPTPYCGFQHRWENVKKRRCVRRQSSHNNGHCGWLFGSKCVEVSRVLSS